MENLIRTVIEGPCNYLEYSQKWINKKYEHVEPCQIIFFTVLSTLCVVCIKNFLCKPESLISRLKKFTFKNVRRIPLVKKYIDKEIDKTRSSIHEEIHHVDRDYPFLTRLPDKGWTKEKIITESQKYSSFGKVEWDKGKVSGAVYNYENNVVDLATKIFGQFSYTNPLHADVFPSVRRMEAEIVRIVCTMFNGGPDACGCVTSGGTESILMACKAYRDRAYDRGIERPEMVLPITAHAAFDKAAYLMGISQKKIAVHPKTLKVDVRAMKKAISKNTCMLVGSCPQFPHGIIDDIPEIGKLAKQYNVPLHVDCCLGGFMVAFMDKAGFPLEPFDFRLPGVTSISADTHKYGYAPKGTSVLMYRNPDYRKYQYFVTTDWPGGIYASPSLAGSRSGGIIATCWSTLLLIGEEGYIENTKKIIAATKKIIEGIKKIPNLFVMGDPKVSVVALGSNDFNIYRLCDKIGKKGWNLSALQFPSSIHLTVTMMQTQDGVVEQFLKDVQESVTEIMKNPKADEGGKAAIYGMAQSIPDRNLVAELAWVFLDECLNTPDANATKH